MLVLLLYFYRLGYSPFTLAFLFLLYEFAGILANLIGGWLVSFMDYDLGYFDLDSCKVEPLENPFGPKVLTM